MQCHWTTYPKKNPSANNHTASDFFFSEDFHCLFFTVHILMWKHEIYTILKPWICYSKLYTPHTTLVTQQHKEKESTNILERNSYCDNLLEDFEAQQANY